MKIESESEKKTSQQLPLNKYFPPIAPPLSYSQCESDLLKMNISQENKYLQLIFPTDSGLHPLPFSPIPNVICGIFFGIIRSRAMSIFKVLPLKENQFKEV